MGFFDNIKQFVGVGGVKLDLQIPAQFSKEMSELVGKLIITTKSDQKINSVSYKFIEEYTTGRGDEKKEQEFELGRIEDKQAFELKAGEAKEISFTIPFKMLKSSNDELAEKGGMLGGIGKLAKMADNEKSVYKVKVDVDVDKTAGIFDPSVDKEIKFI
jgi:hypothetical protein